MFGYKETDGLMTDIEQLKEQGLNVSCVNLSCGYYEPHTDNEYTSKKDLLNCLRFIEHIITNCKKTYKHEAEYDDRTYLNFAYSSWDIYDELFEIIREVLLADPTLTPADIYAFYGTDYPFTMDDFAMVYEDAMNEILYEKQEDWQWKDIKPYVVEYQTIKQIGRTDIPKHGKTHFKKRQITIQNVAFYNAINGILEFEQKPAKQQPKQKSDETQEKRKPKRSDYKAFQAA